MVIVFVAAGLGAALAAGGRAGSDLVALFVLGGAALAGVVAILITRRFRSGVAGPGICASCGRALAPSAPYCKHCGQRR